MMTLHAWARRLARQPTGLRSIRWFVLSALLVASCAHGKSTEEHPSPAASHVEPAVEETEAVGAVADVDGDGVPNDEDACPIEPGLNEGEPCVKAWGFFFLRVLNANRLPVSADLVFQPAINQVVPREDGFSGKLRPGVYRVEAVAPGYASSELTFEVKAEEKAFLELVLETDEAPQ